MNNKILGDRAFKKGCDSFTSINVLRGDKRFKEGQEQLESAIEFYLRGDCDDDAAKAALKLAEYFEQYVQSKGKGYVHEMAKYWELAGDCLEDLNNKKCIECYKKCAYYQKSDNNFQGAAKTYQIIAQIEAKKDHTKEALQAYDDAIEAFLMENSTAHAAKVYIEKAEFYAKDHSYKEAALTFFELVKAGYAAQKNNENCLKSLLAMFAYTAISQDISHVEQHDVELQNVNPGWVKCYERKMIRNAIEAYKANNEASFTRVLKDWDHISELSAWTIDLLLVVKRVMMGKYDITGQDTKYEYIATVKTPDMTADDHEDVAQGIFHKTAIVEPTRSEKIQDLLM